jgi:Rod binding domain-containing protein
MAASVALPAPGLSASDLMLANVQAAKKPNAAAQTKAHAAAQDFEAVFLNSMFQQMFTGTDGEGPMGGSGASGVWRSMMVDEISKKVARAGGVGLSNQIYKSLLALQEVRQ